MPLPARILPFAQILIFVIVTCGVYSTGRAADVHPQITRVVEMAQKQPDWKKQVTLSAKMWAVRKVINEELSIVSDPVSDRYLITKLGGPIDLVHFLALSAQTCSGQLSLEAALGAQWKSEGGEDFKAGTKFGSPPEAHPDDLPSNALGALLGIEVQNRENDPNADITTVLDEFFAPFQPVSDKVAKEFSHRTIVMGLTEKSTWKQEESRSEWFTALPIFILTAVDPELRKAIPNATVALRKAGFQVYEIEGNPIGIRRIAVTPPQQTE